ncbi:hypothetical protein AKJ16_DCAP03978 [Drosera capensis]
MKHLFIIGKSESTTLSKHAPTCSKSTGHGRFITTWHGTTQSLSPPFSASPRRSLSAPCFTRRRRRGPPMAFISSSHPTLTSLSIPPTIESSTTAIAAVRFPKPRRIPAAIQAAEASSSDVAASAAEFEEGWLRETVVDRRDAVVAAGGGR